MHSGTLRPMFVPRSPWLAYWISQKHGKHGVRKDVSFSGGDSETWPLSLKLEVITVLAMFQRDTKPANFTGRTKVHQQPIKGVLSPSEYGGSLEIWSPSNGIVFKTKASSYDILLSSGGRKKKHEATNVLFINVLKKFILLSKSQSYSLTVCASTLQMREK